MRTKRLLIAVLVLLALVLAILPVNAGGTKLMKVYIHVYERQGIYKWEARNCEVHLYVPQAYGHVIASGRTDSNGYKLLQGTAYVGDDIGVWIRRNEAEPPFYTTIPLRHVGYVGTTGTNRWSLYVCYYHDSGYTYYSWIPLPPDR